MNSKKQNKPSNSSFKKSLSPRRRKNGVHRLRKRETGRTVYSLGFNSEHRDGSDEEMPRGPPTGINQLN